MNRAEKAAVVEELASEIQEAETIFAIDYRGISVPQAAELRARLRDADARFRVVKNTLSERAADEAGADALKALLEGPTALAFVKGDAALAAKALNDAARATNVLDFKGGVMNGSTLTAEDIRSIARLPAREVLYGHLVGVVASPVTSLVRGLNQLISGLAVALQQIHDEGKVGDASAEMPSLDAQEDTQKAAEQPDPDDPDTGPASEPGADQPDQAEGEDTPAETQE